MHRRWLLSAVVTVGLVLSLLQPTTAMAVEAEPDPVGVEPLTSEARMPDVAFDPVGDFSELAAGSCR